MPTNLMHNITGGSSDPPTLEEEVCEMCPKMTYQQVRMMPREWPSRTERGRAFSRAAPDRILLYVRFRLLHQLCRACARVRLSAARARIAFDARAASPHTHTRSLSQGYVILMKEGTSNPDAIKKFVALYVVGNFIALFATMFVIGPKKQCKKMFEDTRRKTTCFWLFTLVLVLVLACIPRMNLFVIFLALVLQIGASTWYGATYIPYGRRMIIRFCQGTCFSPCPDACKPIEKCTGA